MNLALKDIRHNLLRFILAALGVGLLMSATIGMSGLYRGIVFEAMLIVNSVGADLWVVEGGRFGPFAEPSAVPGNLDRRVEGVSGVESTRRFIQYNQQFDINGKSMRVAVTSVDFPRDGGDWIPLIAGRHFQASRFEAIADVSLGLAVDDRLKLGREIYTIVGVSRGQVDMAGDGMLFVSIADAQQINRMLPSEAILLNRAAKGRSRMGGGEGGSVAAVMVKLKPGADAEAVRETIMRWGDVEVLTRQDQQTMLLDSRLWRLRIQILAFTAMTLVVCGTVIALTIYTMTLEKISQIALLKLIGARDWVIVKLIAQQSLMIGAIGFVFGLVDSVLLYPHFPRKVLMLPTDLAVLGGVLIVISLLASFFAIRRALSVRAQEVLS
jgi:putative ABC transport system permease protein